MTEDIVDQIIEEFQKCHLDHPIGKFFGDCTELKIKLDQCFRQEVSLNFCATTLCVCILLPDMHICTWDFDQIIVFTFCRKLWSGRQTSSRARNWKKGSSHWGKKLLRLKQNFEFDFDFELSIIWFQRSIMWLV